MSPHIRTTHCQLLNEITNFEYNLYNPSKSNLSLEPNNLGYCPTVPYSLDKELLEKSSDGFGHIFKTDNGESLYSVCRFHNIKVNM
ncbi:MAG: hypothetical protein RRZ84_09205 [Romboutsia sp.]